MRIALSGFTGKDSTILNQVVKILKTLEYEGAMTQKDLINKTMLPERTIRLSLSHLLNRGYVKKKISLRDARQKIYELKI